MLVSCQAPLVRLFETTPGVDKVVATGDAVEGYDCHASLVSLPGLFETSLETVPGETPYLGVPETREVSPGPPPAAAGKRSIGFAWAGNPDHLNDRNRSCPRTHFLDLAGRADVALFSLQKEQPPHDRLEEGEARDLAPGLGDVADTAAALEGLDLVITVDTALAHLAGALGRPVWVVLPRVPDWRWMLGRDDSPWYPTMRLFRQQRASDWAGVFKRVAAALGRAA